MMWYQSQFLTWDMFGCITGLYLSSLVISWHNENVVVGTIYINEFLLIMYAYFEVLEALANGKQHLT